MGKNNAKLYDFAPYIQAGIDPKTKMPMKMADNKCMLAENIKRQLRIKDETEFVRRYRWYNLPNGLDAELIERILYYRYQGAFFFMKSDMKFYFLPYALVGNIDVYGRYLHVTPVPFAGPSEDGKERPWIVGMEKKVYYDFPEDDELLEAFEDGAVLLYDYTKQMGQSGVPRAVLQDVVLEMESEAFPMARTSLLANSGIKGYRVNSDDEAAEVKLASKSVTNAAKVGDPWIPITAQVEFQELTSAGSALKTEEYLLYLQSLDNYRQSTMGLGDGSLFQKKAHELQTEAIGNQGASKSIYDDGLIIRQNFCDIVNSIWGLGIYCTASEQMMMADMNGDGMIGDNQDQSGTQEGEQPQEVANE